MASTLTPSPTFSPTTVQLLGAEARLGLWARVFVLTICWVQPAAKELKAAFIWRGATPLDWRSALILSRKACSLLLAARAGRWRATPEKAATATATRTSFTRARW